MTTCYSGIVAFSNHIEYYMTQSIKNLSTLKGLCFVKREYNISMKDIIYDFCGNVVNKDLS